jgi:hypothetical protein
VRRNQRGAGTNRTACNERVGKTRDHLRASAHGHGFVLEEVAAGACVIEMRTRGVVPTHQQPHPVWPLPRSLRANLRLVRHLRTARPLRSSAFAAVEEMRGDGRCRNQCDGKAVAAD